METIETVTYDTYEDVLIKGESNVSANALAEISVDHLDVGMKTQVTLAGLEAFVDEQGLSSSTAELVNDQVQTTSTKIVFIDPPSSSLGIQHDDLLEESNDNNLRLFADFDQRIKDFTDIVSIAGFRCKICSFYTIEANSYKEHLTKSHGDIANVKVIRPVKPSKITGRNLLTETVAVEEEEKVSWTCKICFKTVTASESRHMRSCHPEMCNIKCIFCGMLFYSENHLKNHTATVHHFKKWKCEHCWREYSTPEPLEAHITKEHPEKVKGRVCTICNVVCADAARLNTHIQEKHRKHIVKCEYCDQTCSKGKNLYGHLLEFHPEAFKFQCFACCDRFLSLKFLKKHEASVHKIGGHPCNYCDRILMNGDCLQKHLKRLHPEVTVKFAYGCKLCNLSFSSDAEFKEHNDQFHKNKSLKCPYCPAVYTKKFNLDHHHKTHHPEIMIYSCDLCVNTFYSSKTLQRHKSRAHGPKTKSCPYCPLMLSAKTRLSDHLKTHRKHIRQSEKSQEK